MAEIQLIMPEMGESVTDATISNWLVSEGDMVEVDQDILEVATDKVDTEVPSPASGVIKQILHHEGDVVDVGKPLAIIEVEGEAADVSASPAVKKQESEPAVTEDELKHPQPPFVPQNQPAAETSISSENDDNYYSPLVRNIAKQEGITSDELSTIEGTGLGGRVTKDDILSYVSDRETNGQTYQQANTAKAAPQPTPEPQKLPAQSKVKSAVDGEIVEMDRMRKLIADHMVNSAYTSPHVTLFIEADVTNLVNWRNNAKKEFQQREGEKLTFTPLFVEAVTKAIKAFPQVNASVVDQYKIHYKKPINIGMATALPSGNLIVPVIKNTADKTLSALAKDVNDLAGRARNNKLKPDDTVGGTFTLTNIGTFDNLMGTPIINQPQSAILATGAIQKKPVVLETEQGDVIAIRQMMYLSLAMDHRIIDGALGGAFLKRVKDELEGWNTDREV